MLTKRSHRKVRLVPVLGLLILLLNLPEQMEFPQLSWKCRHPNVSELFEEFTSKVS